jgi:hypothetical protein
MPIPKTDPFRPRKCRFCKLQFKPSGKDPANARRQEFCTPSHRKEFWKRGALPMDKLLFRLEKPLREMARQIAREEIEAALQSVETGKRLWEALQDPPTKTAPLPAERI